MSLIYLIIDIDNDNLIPQIMPYRISPHPQPGHPLTFARVAPRFSCSSGLVPGLRWMFWMHNEDNQTENTRDYWAGPAQPSTIWMGGGETGGPPPSSPELQLVLSCCLLGQAVRCGHQPGGRRNILGGLGDLGGGRGEVWGGSNHHDSLEQFISSIML